MFPLEPIDAVRTRLTHSLEVSSMARGLANGVCQKLIQSKLVSHEDAYAIETIAATCGLLHDIGNPPFGHFGETAIRDWFLNESIKNPNSLNFDYPSGETLRKDLLNFEGNAQTIRLLSKLQVLSDRYGLNLTAATFSALSKYTANSLEIGKPNFQSKKKLGYFTSEKNIIDLVRKETGTGDSRNPISLLVEASDDMVYSVVDIEDAIKKSVITWADVVAYLEEHGGPLGKELCQAAHSTIGKSTLLKHLNRDARDEGTAQYFRTFLMRDASEAVQQTFIKLYEPIMNGTYEGELLYDSDAGPTYKALKDFAAKRVYNAKEILRLELLGHHVIHSLLDIFSVSEVSPKTKTFGQKAYALMSQNYRLIYETPDEWELTLPDPYRKALLATDYICGMTDSFAMNLHQELTHG